MPKKAKYTWQMAEELYGLDFEDIYYKRLGGHAWRVLSGPFTETTIKRLTQDWCRDNGYDPETTERSNLDYGIITDPKRVDAGKAKALRKAGWSLFDIAIDCNCTEECLKEIFDVTG